MRDFNKVPKSVKAMLKDFLHVKRLGSRVLAHHAPSLLVLLAVASAMVQMDSRNRALCFMYRNLPPSQKRLSFKEIAAVVKKVRMRRNPQSH